MFHIALQCSWNLYQSHLYYKKILSFLYNTELDYRFNTTIPNRSVSFYIPNLSTDFKWTVSTIYTSNRKHNISQNILYYPFWYLKTCTQSVLLNLVIQNSVDILKTLLKNALIFQVFSKDYEDISQCKNISITFKMAHM